ncbi:hypothetical protein OS493_039767, partial [Desmophyllum pertusum]
MAFKCCGVDDDGYTLYLKGNNTNATFPESCCANKTGCPTTVGECKEGNKGKPRCIQENGMFRRCFKTIPQRSPCYCWEELVSRGIAFIQ